MSSRSEPQHQNFQPQNPTSPNHNDQIQSPKTPNPQNQDDPDQPNPDSSQNGHQNPQEVIQQEDPEGQNQEVDNPDQPLSESGMPICPPAPIIVPIQGTCDPTLTSPTNPLRRTNKRKKGKANIKKLQAIEKKLNTLMENLKPVPFVPARILDFDKHEKLLKRLGLWDFVHVEFDQFIRGDLIAQLVANYDPKNRASYVNDMRILVNRADLARAFGLPVKKEKGGSLVEGVELCSEPLFDESILFLEEFVSNWVLLHGEMWIMPDEVVNWTKVIKEGHPEKVDWAGLLWFMVEKELTKGEQLTECYYASHLQYLIKSKREDVFKVEPRVEEVDLEVEEVREEEEIKEEEEVREEEEIKEEEDGADGGDGDVKVAEGIDCRTEGNDDDVLTEEPNVELTLGQDSGEKDEVKEEDMGIEGCKEDIDARWTLDGRNSMGDHFLQRCSLGDIGGLSSHEEMKHGDELEMEEGEEGEEEEDEEGDEGETEDGLNVSDNDVGAFGRPGLTGNLLQRMETAHISFGLQGLHDHSSAELLDARAEMQPSFGGTSFFGNGGKRPIQDDNDMSHYSLNAANKRLKTDGLWDNKPADFGMCMEQVEQLLARARMMYEEKESAIEQVNNNQQFLYDELQKRDGLIELLHKTKSEELHKKNEMIYRLERELFIMERLLAGYKKALKESQRVFAEFREKHHIPDEPIYKDAGPGGLMLTTAEIEIQRRRQEEIDKSNRLLLEQKAMEAEDGYTKIFLGYSDQVDVLESRLTGLENTVKLLVGMCAKRKVAEAPECHPEIE